MFRGYVDRRDRRKLEKSLSAALENAYLITVLGVKKAKEKVPTKVDLPRIIQPFHNIVRMYGEPDPDEIVPTVFLAVTMPLIFGLMFPDMGHGLLVLLFAIYMLGKDSVWRPVLIALSSVSIITGFLAGELFGPVVSEKVGLYSFWEHLGFETPPLAQPTYAFEAGLGGELANLLLFKIITISLWLAAFMLSFGTFLGFVDALLKGDKEEAFASKLPTFIFFFSATLPFLVVFDVKTSGGIIGSALGISHHSEYMTLQYIVRYGALLGLLWKLLGEPIALALEGENPLKGLGHSFMETYEMIAMALGNVPSFLRILGLGLAHAGLMLGFAKLYHLMAEGGIVGLAGGILVYIIGNLMVAALEAIIALAHSLRLHFYEWFSKFYSGQGITFTPVRLEGVKIIIKSV
jgi:V/A-type H+-transporting ATPase subunit I